MLSSLALGRDGVWLMTPPPPAAGRDGVSVSSAAGALARREPRKGNIRRGGGTRPAYALAGEFVKFA